MDESNALAVQVEDMTVSYHERPVLWDVDLRLEKGKMTAIVGPNGAGKSTLIKAILGLIPITSGYVSILGKNIKDARKSIAYVPQSGSVDWQFPTSVLDVVMMGTYGSLGYLKRPGAKEKALAVDALKKVGMYEFADRQISMLSGGQQQRVFLARALVQDAEVYFLDEPLKGVDIKTEKTIMSILKSLRDEGKNVIVVHHDLRTVPEYFDDVVIMKVSVVACGSVEDVLIPENINKAYGRVD